MKRKITVTLATTLLLTGLLAAAAWAASTYGTPKALNQAILFAVSEGDINNLASLRDKGANLDTTLHEAGLSPEGVFGHHPGMASLLATTADVEYWPLLTWAVFLEDEDAVRVLVKSGAFLSGTDRDGTTPLHWAAWRGNYPIAKMLIENGAEPCMMDTRFRSPLDFALLSGQADIIRLLPKCPPPPPPADSDGDGIIDDLDQCPCTPRGAPVDERGCWVAAFAEFFDTNSAVVKKKYLPFLQQNAMVLNANPHLVVELAGHTDSRASEKYNLKLGLRRAEAIKKVLVRYGVSADRLLIKSYGEGQPVADNTTAAGMAKNRRVEVNIMTPVTSNCRH